MVSSTRKASTVFIEISGGCNAKCPYCAQRRLRQEGRYRDIMSAELFEQILGHLFKIGIIKKDYNTTVYLYNWGEPFLNPGINRILQILNKNKIYAGISSNFIIKPDIDKTCLPIVNAVIFSLSGLSQDSYGRIHGAPIDKVLNNFEGFYKKIRTYSPKTRIIISWHRYSFNENELWDAYRYFNRPGISFSPVPAFLNDALEMMAYLEERLSQERKEQVEKDIFLEHIRKRIAYHRKRSKNYRCPNWDCLVIDEIGQLLLCCGITRHDSAHVLGNVLEMSGEEIWKNKFSDPLCNKCISCGFARWANARDTGGLYDLPWPSGGGLCHLKLWFQNRDPAQFILKHLSRILRKLPDGGKIIHRVKNIKNRDFIN